MCWLYVNLLMVSECPACPGRGVCFGGDGIGAVCKACAQPIVL